jgi:uncharacterized Zn finger protein (UPF0148 family)
MAFCVKCGVELAEGAKFCTSCGTPAGGAPAESGAPAPKPRTVTDGQVKKCPNCGAPLEAFQAKCPSCGHELRGLEAGGAIKEFSKELAKLQNEAASLSRNPYEWNEKGNNAQYEAHAAKSNAAKKRLAGFIERFVVPNTKEDMLEFMVLAAPLTNRERTYNSEVRGAWRTKCAQIYEKSKLSFAGDTASLEKMKGILAQHCDFDAAGAIIWGDEKKLYQKLGIPKKVWDMIMASLLVAGIIIFVILFIIYGLL